jgi:hypothetical protein
VISREEHGDPTADNLDCGDGSDDVRSDSVDTLNGGCEAISTFSNGLHLGTQPAIDADSADFILRCSGGSGPQGCTGTITLTGLDGQQFGMIHFATPSDAKPAPVSVPLSPTSIAALQAGTTVQVDIRPDNPNLEDPGGYRQFMRAQ